MFSSFRDIDDKRDYKHNLVTVLSLTWIVVTCADMVLAMIVVPSGISRWLLVIGLVLTICGASMLVNRQGHTRVASVMLPLMAWLVISLLAITADGINAVAILSFSSVIFTAGFLVGGRFGIFVAVLCLLSSLLLAYAGYLGILPHPGFVYTPLTKWVAYLLPFTMAAAIQYTTTRYMRGAFEELRNEAELRKGIEANLNTIFSTTNVSYVLLDEKLNIISFNKAAADFCLRELHKVARSGENFAQYVSDARSPALKRITAEVLEGTQARYERSYVQPDGTTHYYDVSLSPITPEGNKVSGFLLTLSDITAQKTAEQEIKILNGSLEKRVEERTRELVAANRELETFSYSVSHDLQSPLRVIKGYSSLLLHKHITKLDEDDKKFLTSINSNVSKMSTLIKDLLAFSRLSKTPLDKKYIDMNDLVATVLSELIQPEDDRKLKVQLDDILPATCDPVLIRLVWMNLLSNAVKYSSKKETPVVQIGHQKKGDTVVYYVKDNGTGFDMKYADKVFGVFERLHNREEYEGTGIGLATVERIISRHGGKVWFDAKPDEGATFYFTVN